MSPSIHCGQSFASDATTAVQELYAQLADPQTELVIFFCSSHYDLEVLTTAINKLFANTQVIGCTTAGEIGPQGYLVHSLCGASFSNCDFTAVSTCLDVGAALSSEATRATIHQLLAALDQKSGPQSGSNRFALQLIDGLSQAEEWLSQLLQRALGKVPLIGGSAGDDLKMTSPQVFYQGRFHAHVLVLMIIDSLCPIKIFKTQNFIAGHEPLVVTEADIHTRKILELNGLPATEAYARTLGVEIQALNAAIFASSPVVVQLNGNLYVRSIQHANPDGSLSFYCAIDRGMILRVAQSVDLVSDLKSAFTQIELTLGEPQLVLAFDCVLRRLDIERNQLLPQIEAITRRYNTLGFNTYGEQFLGIHVNQTFTGIAIGSRHHG